jgi:plasmid maintenance system killer protein
MSLEIKNEEKVEKNDISEKEIQEFQKNLTAHIQAIMAANNEEIENNVHDNYFKSLNERINEHLVNLEQKGEVLHVSAQSQQYFSEVMSELHDPADNTAL